MVIIMANARETALTVLYEVEYHGAYSDMALKNALAHTSLSQTDKGFVTRLVYGVIQYKLTLDYMICRYSKLKKNKISKYILLILRMGVYQMQFMDRVPDSAAVNESVKLARRYGHGGSVGFVNGVLRAVIRGRGSFSYPEDREQYLSVKYSFPLELVRHWIDTFGDSFTEELLCAMNETPILSLRVNTLKTTPEEVVKKLENAHISELYKDAVLCDGFDVSSSEVYRQGLVTAQDISAMMAGIVLAPQPNDTVLDMCAAPGGKTTHMAQLMNNTGKIIAFDIHEHKMDLIEKNARRLGISMIETVCADSSTYIDRYRESADKVLADVPCSGLGIIRKKPDIKWNDKLSNIADIQTAILENAARYVKCGGQLVYSTCTIERAENEDVIERFLSCHKDFTAVDITNALPVPLCKQTAKDGYVTFYPNIDGIDGFFICKLQKRSI